MSTETKTKIKKLKPATKIRAVKAVEPLDIIELAEVTTIVVDHIDPDVEAFATEEEEEVIIPVVVAKKKNYLNNKDLLAQVLDSKKQCQMNNELANMLITLCKRYARKGNFAMYSYNDDMQSYAMLMLVKTWNSFNPEKSKNPFAFYTQCIKNSFVQYLNQESRQRDVKNELLIDNGLNPSHSYILEYENDQFEKRQSLFDDSPPIEKNDFTSQAYANLYPEDTDDSNADRFKSNE